MKIGYCRVSTDDQNPDMQLAALKRAGCKKIFTDKATGAHVKRPELAKCLKALKAGDVLIVWKLDRLGRSLHDLIGLLDDLKTRGVASGRSLRQSTRQPLQDAPCGKWWGYWQNWKDRSFRNALRRVEQLRWHVA